MYKRLFAITCLILTLRLGWVSVTAGQGAMKKPRPKPPVSQQKPSVTPEPKPGSSAPSKARNNETPLAGPGKSVRISATLGSGVFKSGSEQYNFRTFRNEFVGVQSPTWLITIAIENRTANSLELGESLMVVETIKDNPLYLTSYLIRERAAPVNHLHRFGERYQLLWGYKIDKGGNALIPFMALADVSGGGAEGFLSLFSATLNSPKVETYEGLGYGRVGPGARRKLKVELVAPLGFGKRKEEIFVVLPSFRPSGRSAGARTYTICRFDADEPHKLLETISVTTGATVLSAVVNDERLPLWRRIFALNWLAEEHRREAESLLLRLAANPNQPVGLRNSAIANLGAWRMKTAVAPLLAMLEGPADDAIKKNTIEALADIGDQTAATKLRAHFNHTNDDLAIAAIAATGKLKDSVSVDLLSAILRDGQKTKRHQTCVNALQAIGNGTAVGALGQLLASEKTADGLRPQLVSALRAIGGTQVIAILSDAYRNEKDEHTGRAMVTALIELHYSDQSLASFLIERLDPKKNPLWFEDVRLLRHLTGKKFGPENKWSGADKEREAELEKWRRWWANRK